MKNGKIGVTTENIFPVIKKFLYSDHEIFLRELISNAVDATQKLKTLSSMGEAKGELGDLAIRVAADKERKTLTVTDRGVGMTAEEVDRYINQIAFSGAEEFMAKYKDQAIIGHFGLVVSSFSLAFFWIALMSSIALSRASAIFLCIAMWSLPSSSTSTKYGFHPHPSKKCSSSS